MTGVTDIKRANGKTRKVLTAHNIDDFKAEGGSLYVSRNEGGGDFTSLEMSFKTTNIILKHTLILHLTG